MSEDIGRGAPGELLRPEVTGASPKRKFLVGCLIALLVFIVLCVIAGMYGSRYFRRQYEVAVAEFEGMGFRRVEAPEGQEALNVTEPVDERLLYVARRVAFNTDANADIAIFASEAIVTGSVAGNVYFRGLTITIAETSVIHGDLNVTARDVIIRGTVHGQVVGEYRTMTPSPEPAPPITVEPAPGAPPSLQPDPTTPPAAEPLPPAEEPVPPPQEPVAGPAPPAQELPPAPE